MARKWRSVEHNAQIYALFVMLGSITQDQKWEFNILFLRGDVMLTYIMFTYFDDDIDMDHAKYFVNYCFDISAGLYNTGLQSAPFLILCL